MNADFTATDEVEEVWFIAVDTSGCTVPERTARIVRTATHG